MIVIYTNNDPYTVKGADFGKSYSYMPNDMVEIVLTKLTKSASIVLDKLLDLLDSNNMELIGTDGYRRIIFHTKSELAEILGTNKQYIQKAINNLEENNIVKYKNGVLMINPLVFANSNLYDIRVLEAFNLMYLVK